MEKAEMKYVVICVEADTIQNLANVVRYIGRDIESMTRNKALPASTTSSFGAWHVCDGELPNLDAIKELARPKK
jgi:hypothetical protein